MSHQVDLSDATFERLQKLAVPLVDSIETVITKLADFYEREHSAQTNPRVAQTAEGPRPFSAASPPDLTHTKVLSVKLGGTPLTKANWNGLLFEIIRRAKDRLSSEDDARRLIIVKFVHGKKDEEGYRFIPEVGLSVQGQDANSAWRGACHIAQQLGIPVNVEFLWRAKEGAAFPGVTGRLSA